MPEKARMWQILEGDQLMELKQVPLELEERIETWLERDISILSGDLLVIGRQVATAFGGSIDILCLDSNGDVAIVELKRDRTPREVTAQTLDYASWVQDLSHEQITQLADRYLDDRGPLDRAFENKFGESLPDTLNQRHKMLIVASEVDASTERIINYLSETHGVDINFVSFQYLQGQDGCQYLARVFLIEPSKVEQSSRTVTRSKRMPPLTDQELQTMADDNGVGELYRQLVQGLSGVFDTKNRTRSSLGFVGNMQGGRRTLFNLLPGKSNATQGVYFEAKIDKLVQYLRVDEERLRLAFPPEVEDRIRWENERHLEGFLQTSQQIEQIVSGLRDLKSARGR